MAEFSELLAYLLSSAGLTVLIVWPQTGLGAWLRERVLRPMLQGRGGEVLDCYICCGFWSGLALSPVWWLACRHFWCWTGCLMTPYLFWIHLRDAGLPKKLDEAETEREGS